MPREMNNNTYYRASEVCEIAGISRGTLYLWIKKGLITDSELKDRNGWRLFSQEEVKKIKSVADKTQKA